jgi:hypothetical protein
MSKKYSRKAQVAARYQVDVRTVPRMVEDGRIPPPDFYNGRFPLWDDEKLDENDRRAAARSQSKRVERNDAA